MHNAIAVFVHTLELYICMCFRRHQKNTIQYWFQAMGRVWRTHSTGSCWKEQKSAAACIISGNNNNNHHIAAISVCTSARLSPNTRSSSVFKRRYGCLFNDINALQGSYRRQYDDDNRDNDPTLQWLRRLRWQWQFSRQYNCFLRYADTTIWLCRHRHRRHHHPHPLAKTTMQSNV